MSSDRRVGTRRLELSYVRKMSPDGWYQEKDRRWVPTIPNSFGLPSGTTCPGMTKFCDGCYAAEAENSKSVRAKLERNLALIEEVATVAAMVELLDAMMHRYWRTVTRRGVRRHDRIFRIHWAGDFHSVDYAKAWAIVIRCHPQIKFWVYTRSFTPAVNVVPYLVGIPNLALYLSVDQYNLERATPILEADQRIKAARCGEDVYTTRELLPDRPASVCPENLDHKLLVVDGRGACLNCRICPQGSQDVIFVTMGHKATTPQLTFPLDDLKVRRT